MTRTEIKKIAKNLILHLGVNCGYIVYMDFDLNDNEKNLLSVEIQKQLNRKGA